jgi:D-3-phosphoglycerate dehydrogenase
MTFRVLVPQPIATEGLEVLRRAGLEAVQPPSADLQTLKTWIRDCQAVLVRTVPISRELLEEAPGMKVISRHGAGVDNVDLDYCRERGIRVTYAPESNAVSVAEHALMLLLSVSKNVVRFDAEVRCGNFESRNSNYSVELQGKTLGVVGLGRIGRLVASRAAAGLGMQILGFDPYADEKTLDPVIAPVPFERLLGESDAITVHVPLTSATHGLIGTAELWRMKQGSFLVNCSRGGVVDEAALESAVRSGQLRGAALDVFDSEPLPAGHALTDVPNIILTPHTAALTDGAMVRMAVHAAQGIVSVMQDQEAQWPVK